MKEKLENREGSPVLFELNSKPFSAKVFRRELLFERGHIEQKFDPPDPREMESKLQNYIEESIILREATSKIDFNSSDARAYLWPFIRRAAISYYLEKESGAFDLVENYSDTEVPKEIIQEYYKKNSARFKGESEKEVLKKINNTAIYLKWKKLYDNTLEKKKLLIGRMKRDNRVKLEPKEILKPE